METEKQQRRRINQVIEKNPRGIIIIIMCVCYYYIEGKLGTEETTHKHTQNEILSRAHCWVHSVFVANKKQIYIMCIMWHQNV